jgi:hypothetical protein
VIYRSCLSHLKVEKSFCPSLSPCIPARSTALMCTTAAVHRDLDASPFEHAGESHAGELAALVGVEDLWFAEAQQRLQQRRNAERHVHGVGQARQLSTARLA